MIIFFKEWEAALLILFHSTTTIGTLLISDIFILTHFVEVRYITFTNCADIR